MAPSQIDWFRILADLRNSGMSHCDVSRAIGVPRTRIKEWWLNGRSPRFDDGALLVMLWLDRCKSIQLGGNFEIKGNPTSEQLATACLSVRFVEIPRTGRETRRSSVAPAEREG